MSPEETKIIHARLCQLESECKSKTGSKGFAGLAITTDAYGGIQWRAGMHMLPDEHGARIEDVSAWGECPLSAIEAAFAEFKRRTKESEAA